MTTLWYFGRFDAHAKEHILLSAALTYLIAYASSRLGLSLPATLGWSAGLAFAAGVLWEVFDFLYSLSDDLFLWRADHPRTARFLDSVWDPNGADLLDLLWDLCGISGALVLIMIVFFRTM